MDATTTALPAPDPAQRAPSWLGFLRGELAPTPGRFNATVRIVVGTAIVLLTSMALEVPYIDLSAYVVMFLTVAAPGAATRNSVFVPVAAVLAMTVITVSIALTILVFRFTMDYPPLRLGAMALVSFIGMYLARVLPSRAAGFLLALVIFVSQAYVDIFPGGEPALRSVLWLWVAVGYPAAVAAAVNILLLPADPEPLLRRELAERLRAVARAIDAPRAGDELAKFATLGSAGLLKLVGLAEIRDASLKPLHAERVAKIGLVQDLVAAAALFADLAIEPSPAQRARLARVAAACERFAAALSSAAAALPVLPSADVESDAAASALTPVLARLERIVRELPLAERPAADQPGHGKQSIAADAWTNPRYARFALKVTLATMLCYIAYTAVDWWGIHTCMITCSIVALGSAGATIHKSALRLLGCAIGGSLALASIVFLVPHMTSIAQLVLLLAAVAALAGWIAMGSERTGYAGLQIAFAFYLAVLQGFLPGTDVTEPRDRFVGIVFGVVVMALVFSYVWPERAGTGMLRALETARRLVGEIAAGTGDARAQRAAAWQALAEAERLAELFMFEAEALTPEGRERGRLARRLIELTRRVLLVQSALDRAADAALLREALAERMAALERAAGAA